MNAEPNKEEELPEDEAAVDQTEEAQAAEGAEAEPDPLDILQAENAELKDRLMRALAEVENVRRRADKDRQDAAKYGPSGLAKELLGAIDNLGRAVQAVTDEERDADPAMYKAAQEEGGPTADAGEAPGADADASTGADDNVVDAEFEEVDDDKKDKA